MFRKAGGWSGRASTAALFKPSKLGEFCGAADVEGWRCLALLTGNQNAMDGFARINA